MRKMRRIVPAAAAALFILAGSVWLLSSRAAGPFISLNAANGILSGGATIVSDVTAANGRAVKFPPAGAGNDPVIAAAGDIACDPANNTVGAGRCRQSFTANLIKADSSIQAVLSLGDNQYDCGSLSAFQQSYDKSWGAFKSKTRPVVGNHEYLTSGGGTGCDSTNAGAEGHWDYFGALAGTKGQGYYSYDLGAWHIIALNSNCSKVGGCSPGNPQNTWLKNDLAAHPAACTLAYWHHPLFSQDTSGGAANAASKPLWDVLYAARADVILTGHSHNYERYPLLNPSGSTDNAQGIRQFIVGTGGANLTPFDATKLPRPTVINNTTFGILKLTLHPASYSWQFVPDPNGTSTFTDSSSANCH
jgi:acid phosphatase type 7